MAMSLNQAFEAFWAQLAPQVGISIHHPFKSKLRDVFFIGAANGSSLAVTQPAELALEMIAFHREKQRQVVIEKQKQEQSEKETQVAKDEKTQLEEAALELAAFHACKCLCGGVGCESCAPKVRR